MPLVTLDEILRDTRSQKRAVSAFNVANYESTRAVVEGAESMRSPVTP